MVDTDRRTVLEAVGAASLPLVAGCTGVLDGGGDDGGTNGPPGYRDWFAAESAIDSADDGYLYAVFDVAALAELDDDEGTETEETTTEGSASDPLVTNPVRIYVAAAFLTLRYGQMGVGSLFDGMDEGSSPIDRWILIGGHSVVEGSFDADELASELEDDGYDDPSEVGDFSLYEHPDEQWAVAVRDDAVVVVGGDELGDAGGVARAIVDAERGEATRQHEESDAFDRITRAASDGDLVYGMLPEAETFEESDSDGSNGFGFTTAPFAGATGVSQSLSVDPDASRATARAGVVYGSEEDVDTDRLESELGVQASEFDLDRNGREVSIRATYSEDDVGN